MKKIFFRVLIFISCFMCLSVKAEAIDKFDLIGEASNNLYSWVGTYSNSQDDVEYYFDEDEVVDPLIVWQYMAYVNDVYFGDYVEYEMFQDPENGESYPLSAEFSVPAQLFEDVLLKTFSVDMKYIEDNIRSECQLMMGEGCAYTKVGEDYFYNYKVFYGFGVGVEELDFPLGYKYLGNGYYEMYSYIGSYCANYPIDYANDPDVECEEFKPSDSDVYGEDYVIDVYQYKDEAGNEVIEHQSLKIIGYVRTKVYLDGEYVKFISISKIDKKDMIEKSELVLEESPSVQTKKEDIEINADKGVFVNGTKISVDKITEGLVYEVVTKALQDKSSNFVVYDINAKAGDYAVQPNGKVKVSIKVPDYYKNAVIYYVSVDGKLEKMDTKLENGYAIAELEHFSTYVLVDEKVEEKTEDKVDNAKEETAVENPNTSVFHKLDIILSVTLIVGVLGYMGLKKVKRYNQVEL